MLSADNCTARDDEWISMSTSSVAKAAAIELTSTV
jgi:hypothetical protein